MIRVSLGSKVPFIARGGRGMVAGSPASRMTFPELVPDGRIPDDPGRKLRPGMDWR
jgi:hypothetical protein